MLVNQSLYLGVIYEPTYDYNLSRFEFGLVSVSKYIWVWVLLTSHHMIIMNKQGVC